MESGIHFIPAPSSTYMLGSSILTVLIQPHLSPFLTPSVLCFISLFQGSSKLEVYSTQHSGRHLLDFSSEAETEMMMGPDPLSSGPSEIVDR